MMDKRSTKLMRARRIQLLLAELGVDKCIRTKLKALSGGERKRVSLAVQVSSFLSNKIQQTLSYTRPTVYKPQKLIIRLSPCGVRLSYISFAFKYF